GSRPIRALQPYPRRQPLVVPTPRSIDADHRVFCTLTMFIVIQRLPPRPTLFPYTTLFRSTPFGTRSRLVAPYLVFPYRLYTAYGSEEHTSELQSRFDIVCRLLLEKKNSVNFETGKK